ncbi:hypothetical protein MWU38_02460 [Qipengyuania sp. S6317L1]|uniref:hypothetical protein n=1 Tax=Qipengyuania sp. S6317L1 TaxID=2926410 RepID=UPI001FF15C2A|nr:hypothetical protein [Qipengyuania sp. S6317L1]MCK0098235.1 hypothetical protein [Qipengyuania sp. S6317L1]
MQNGLNDKAPDPGMLYLAIGIGVFSVLASFTLAIYCSGAGAASAASQPLEPVLQADARGAVD